MIAPWQNEKIRGVYERPEIKASLEIILSIFTVVFLLFLAIRPTLATVATLQKKIQDQTVVDSRLGTKIAQLTKANADLGTYADRLPDYFTAVTDSPDESGVAKRIEVIARESNVVINSLIFEPIPLVGQLINLGDKEKGAVKPTLETGGKVASYQFSFDVSGGSTQIFDFLTKMESLDRVVIIKNISLKKEEVKASGTTAAVSNIRAIGKAAAFYILVPSK